MLARPPLLLAVLAVLLTLPLASGAHADGDASTPNTHADTWLVGAYTLRLDPALTTLTIEASIGVERTPLAGTVLTAATIRNEYNARDAAGKEAYLAPLRDLLKTSVDSTLAAMFPSRSPTYTKTPTEVASTFAAGATGPVKFDLVVSVGLDRSAEGLGVYDARKIEGALLAGAAIHLSRSFAAEPGHENTFTVIPPAFGSFTAATAGATLANGQATILADAADSASRVVVGPVRLTLRDPAVTPPAAESIRNEVRITLPSLGGLTGRSIPVSIDVAAHLDSINVTSRFPNVLPSSVTLEGVSAAGLRTLKDRAIVTDTEIATASSRILAEMRETLEATFTGDVTLRGGIANATLDASLPSASPVDFAATAQAQHDIGETPERADAALDAGAVANSTFDLTSREGQSTTFTFVLPEDLVFLDGSVAAGRERTVVVDNRGGSTPLSRSTALRFGRDMVRPDHADMRVAIDVRIREFAKGVDGLPLDVDVTAALYVVDVEARLADMLPPSIELAYLSADGFRELFARGVVSPQDVANATTSLGTEVQKRLVANFGPRVNVSATFDDDSLTEPGPLRFGVRAAVVKDLGVGDPNLKGKVGTVAKVILEAGATVRQDVELVGMAGTNLTYVVHFPERLEASNVTGADSATSQALTIALDAWDDDADPKETVGFTLRDPSAPTFTEAKSEIAIHLDLTLDIDLLEAIERRDADMDMAIDATVRLGVLEVPDSLRGSFPAGVQIRFIPADALRRLWDEGALNETNVQDIEKEFRTRVASGLEGVAGKKVDVTATLDRAALAKKVTGTLSGDDPIELTASAKVKKSLAGGVSATPALTLAAFPISLPLQSFEGLPTEYEVVLPKGIEVGEVQSGPGATMTTGTNGEGRDFILAKVAGGKTTTASMSLAVTPTLLFDQFLGWILLAVALLVLVVAGPIVAIVAYRRRKRASGP